MNVVSEDKFEGCMLGLALGDALGAPFEGGPLERLLWKLIGTTPSGEMRWTDDTQMSLDVAESLIAHQSVNPNDLARRFATSYHWSRGYGPGAAKLLKRIAKGQDWQLANKSVYREGSFGNGGAMRAPVLSLFYALQPDELAHAVELTTSITHAHPLGLEGALLVAKAAALSLQDVEPLEILSVLASTSTHAPFAKRIAVASQWLSSSTLPKPSQVVSELGNGIQATTSCITAIFIALHFYQRPFADMLAFVAQCGGDVDTIGAMAGALWGARRGKRQLPADQLQKLEQQSRISALAKALYAAHHKAVRAVPSRQPPPINDCPP